MFRYPSSVARDSARAIRALRKCVMNADGCWVYTGYKQREGYGWVGGGGHKGTGLVHRLVYEYANGVRVPAGKELDHLCRNPSCCNPDHLEAVSHRENLRRGKTPSARNALKTHCPSGHPYDGNNVRKNPAGARYCLTCRRIRAKNRRKEGKQ